MNASTTDLLNRLLAAGYSQTEIHRRTGIPQPRLSRWKDGKVPTGADDALKLARLAQECLDGSGQDGAASQITRSEGGVSSDALVLGRRAYAPNALTAGVPPDTVGRRKNGPGRRATDRLVVEQVGAQGAEQGV